MAKEKLDNVVENPIFIKLIITSDKTRVYEYDGETVQRSSESGLKNKPKPEKPKNLLKALKAIPTDAYNKCMENAID